MMKLSIGQEKGGNNHFLSSAAWLLRNTSTVPLFLALQLPFFFNGQLWFLLLFSFPFVFFSGFTHLNLS